MDTIADLNEFKEMLNNSTKEQLIEIIVNKACSDTSFELFVKIIYQFQVMLTMFLKCF